MPRLLLLPLVVVLVLTGCAGASDETAADPGSSSTSATTEPTPEETPTGDGQDKNSKDNDNKGKGKNKGKDEQPVAVPDSLDFTATTVSGDRFEGAALAGRPALLWFWAPWCPTCRGQIPQVEGLAEKYDGELGVVGVGSLDSAEAIAGFAGDVGGGITHLEDTEGELWRRFGVTEQSSFVLLDVDGSVAFETGYGGSDELGDQVAGVVG